MQVYLAKLEELCKQFSEPNGEFERKAMQIIHDHMPEITKDCSYFGDFACPGLEINDIIKAKYGEANDFSVCIPCHGVECCDMPEKIKTLQLTVARRIESYK